MHHLILFFKSLYFILHENIKIKKYFLALIDDRFAEGQKYFWNGIKHFVSKTLHLNGLYWSIFINF